MALPRLPPAVLDDATAARLGRLGILPGGRVWPHGGLVPVDHGLREALGEQELIALGAGVFQPQQRWVGAQRVIAHGQHDVIIAHVAVEDHAGDVELVQALHHHHDGGLVRVVQAAGDGLLEQVGRGLTLGVRVGVIHAVRVIDDHPVAPIARDALERAGLPEPGRRGLELSLGVLVAGQHHPVAPAGLIPLRLHEAAHAEAVADGEVLAVAGADIAHAGHVARAPLPRGPEHADQQRLHGARRHVDQQAVVEAVVLLERHLIGDRLKVGADEVDVPAMDVRLARFDDVPRLPNELSKRHLTAPLVDLEQQRGRVERYREINLAHRWRCSSPVLQPAR